MKTEDANYIVHIIPNIDIQYDSIKQNNDKVEQEIINILKNAIKNNKILTEANTQIKYISLNENYCYKKKHPNETEHPNFLKLD